MWTVGTLLHASFSEAELDGSSRERRLREQTDTHQVWTSCREAVAVMSPAPAAAPIGLDLVRSLASHPLAVQLDQEAAGRQPPPGALHSNLLAVLLAGVKSPE